MVGVGVWALLRWLTYSLMAMATVWRRGRDVEAAPSRRSGGHVGSGRVKPRVESGRVPSEYRVGVVRSGPTSPQRVEVRSCRTITTDEKSPQTGRCRREAVCGWLGAIHSRLLVTQCNVGEV